MSGAGREGDSHLLQFQSSELDGSSPVRLFPRSRLGSSVPSHLFLLRHPSMVLGACYWPFPREGHLQDPNQRELIYCLSLVSATITIKTSLNLKDHRKEGKKSGEHSVGGRFLERSEC